jgi:hypothetical protein
LGQPKDRADPRNGPQNYIMPVSGSFQPTEFRQKGFNLQLHIETVFGSKMKLPLTKFHGSQIELLLKQQDRLWETEPLKSALCELEKDI